MRRKLVCQIVAPPQYENVIMENGPGALCNRIIAVKPGPPKPGLCPLPRFEPNGSDAERRVQVLLNLKLCTCYEYDSDSVPNHMLCTCTV